MKFIKSFYIYGFAFLISGATPFILLPLLTRALSPQEFGEVALFLAWTPLMASILGLGSHGYIAVRYFKHDGEDFKSLVKTSLLLVVSSHLILIAVAGVLYPVLSNLTSLPRAYLLIAILTSLLLCINLQNLTLFQISGIPSYYLFLKLTQALFEVGLCLSVIYLNYVTASSRIYTYAVAVGLSVALGFVYCKKLNLLAGSASLKISSGLFKFFLPVMPHIVCGAFIGSMDRLIVSARLGNDALGIYMTAVQIGMALILVIDPMNKVLAPWLFSELSKNDEAKRRMIVIKTYQLYGAILIVGVALYFVANFTFDSIIDDRYGEAKSLIPWIIGGYVLQGFYYTQVNYLFYAEKTGRLSAATCTAAMLGGGISLVLTTEYGLAGAAASFFAVNLLLFTVVWYASAKSVNMPWRLR